MESRGISHKMRRNYPSTPASKHKDCSNLGQPRVTQEKHLQMFLNCTICQRTALGSKNADWIILQGPGSTAGLARKVLAGCDLQPEKPGLGMTCCLLPPSHLWDSKRLLMAGNSAGTRAIP